MDLIGTLRAGLDEVKQGHAQHGSVSLGSILGLVEQIIDILHPEGAAKTAKKEATDGGHDENGQDGQSGSGQESAGGGDGKSERFTFLETDDKGGSEQAKSEQAKSEQAESDRASRPESDSGRPGGTENGITQAPVVAPQEPDGDSAGNAGAEPDGDGHDDAAGPALSQWESEGGQPVPAKGE